MENNNMMARDFLTMSFDEQTAIINATLTNTAKLINSKQTADGTENYKESKAYRDCMVFLFNNHDEAFNEAYANCIEYCADSKYDEMPIALFVSKMSGKALRKAFYWNSKSASELTDTETMVNCADCFDNYGDIFEKDRIESIVSHVRESMREYAMKTVLAMRCGYNTVECAKINGIDEKRQRTVNAMLINAVAIENLYNCEWNRLDAIIASDYSLKDAISRRELESEIVKMYDMTIKPSYKFAHAISWQNALDRLKASDYYNYDEFLKRVKASANK